MKSLRILFASFALLLTQPARAQLTEQQAIDYAKNTWELIDLTDDVISQTLNTHYSGIPFKDWINGLIKAAEVASLLQQQNYSEAARQAAGFAAETGFNYLLTQVELEGVSSVAGLAVWPIEHALYNFVNTVRQRTFADQCAFYFAARAHNTADQIRNAQPFDLLDADVNGGLLYKDQDGWLIRVTCYTCSARVLGFDSATQFYGLAETLWLANDRTQNLDNDQRDVGDAFRAAATPQKPVITQPPQDTVIASGQIATFTVQATGGGTLTYQWYFNGAWLSPVVGPSLQANTPGQYQVIVGNAAGTTPSRIATLTVNNGEPVAITAPAANANASGSVPVRASVSGATKVEFYLDGTRQFTDSSTPFAWTWNTAIVANGPHALTAKAYNGVTLLGTSATLNVTVNNAAPPACSDPNEPNDSSPTATPLAFGVAANGYVCTATDVDWFKVVVAAPGVLTFDLTVPAANDYDIELYGPDYAYIRGSYRDTGLEENITHNATSIGTYYVRVYGYPVGNGSHNAAVSYTLTAGLVSGPVTILTPPQNRSVSAGASASFSVTAAGASPLAFQWQRDNVDIPGATGPTYATSVLALGDSGAQFRVRVTNAFGFVLSAPATLTVNTANVIAWTGISDSNWFNRTNWNPMTVPTVNDVVQLTSANLSVPAGAEFGILNFNGSTLYGDFTNSGTINWTGGTLAGRMTIGASGVLNLAGGADKNLDASQAAALVNAGIVNWTGGNLVSQMYCGYGGFPVAVSNLAGGVFNIQTDAAITVSGCSYWNISNAGLLRKTGGSGTNAWASGVNFNNSGTLNVQSGVMKFNNSLTSGGTVTVATGAGLVFENGSYTFSSGSTLNAAAGAFISYQSGSFTFAPGANLSVSSSNRVTGGVSFSGNMAQQNLEVLAGSTLYGDFTNSGTINWTGGTLAGRMTIGASGVLNLAGGADKNLDASQAAALVNAGIVNWTGGNLVSQMYCGYGGFPVAVSNLAGGVFNIQTDGAITVNGCSYWNISNAGLLRKTGSCGTNVWSGGVNFNNSGTLDVQSGTLSFTSGFAQTAAGTLQLEVGGLSPGSGFGQLVVNGQATLAGVLNVTLINGFTPALSNTFPVLTCTSRSGSFASINLPALPNGLRLNSQYGSTALTLFTTDNPLYNLITGFRPLANGMFSFRFYGDPGAYYRVQASTNLVKWLTVATNQVGLLGYFDFTDVAATNYNRRFYRVAPSSSVISSGPLLTLLLAGNNVVASWPTNAVGFTLESATNLPAVSWTSNSTSPVIVNGQFTVTDAITGGQKFYRLRK